jgi:integral membrane protein
MTVVRVIGIGEGISFLVLLGIAMPLKYAYGMPLAVRVVGMAHGVLFMAFVAGLVWLSGEQSWPRRRLLEGLVASVIPLGTFWFDRRLR